MDTISNYLSAENKFKRSESLPENAQLNYSKLEESLTFTNYFLSTFIAAYYVDLKTLSCQIYKYTPYLANKYPIITNYYEAITDYIKCDVHPDDRDTLISAIQPATMMDHLSRQTDYIHFFRDISGTKERIIRMQVIRGSDSSHAAFGFEDVTDEFEKQEKRILGTIPLSSDILIKANIGLWAFEFDNDKPPRMYVDETMLHLIGLSEQVSPEETFHAWYDHVDEGSYELVAAAVEKMKITHSEVQYPWHHPDGSIMIVRCGGMCNPEYKAGIRIEGTHQNVTEVLHFDEKEVERLKRTEIQLHHERLRSEVLNYMIDHQDDPIELLKNFAERLRNLIGCDQVVYRDLEETRIMLNTTELDKTWSVPIEICRKCPHFDAHHPMYAEGCVEMENCQKGWKGIAVHESCPIKSSLTRIIYCDGEIAGYLAIHFVKKYHQFTDIERSTLEEFARIISISLSRYVAKLRSRELDKVKRKMNMIFSLSDEFDPILVVDPKNGEYDWYMGKANEVARNTSMTVHGDNLYQNIGIDCQSVIHEDDRAQFALFYTKENMMKIARTGEIQETENRWWMEEEKKFRWKYNKAVRMTDEDGKIYIVIGVVDTTEEKEKEEEYKLQRIQLARRTALSDYLIKSYAAAFYCDFSENSILVLRSGNDSDIYHVGQMYSYIELLNNYIDTVIYPDDRNLVFEQLKPENIIEQMKASADFSFVFRINIFSEINHFRCSIIRGDNAHSVVMGFQNITDELRTQHDRQMQLQDALSMAESANRAKTTFLNNMSHDIRTPMNAIIGYTDLAASHINNREQVSDYLGKISQSSNHLLSLINDVLDMSRIESGKMIIEEKEENLSDIIKTICNIIQADINVKKQHFRLQTIDLNNSNIICDRLRLNQVLLNVLSNAIKYTPSEGSIDLIVSEQTGDRAGFGKYSFLIKDTGMGMDEEFLKQIFDPFTRVKSSTVSGIQGTGLGMAITKNIVDMMNGTITINSEPNKGTEVGIFFEFRLQNKKTASEETSDIPDAFSEDLAADFDFTGRKILLVEDNPLNREIATELLVEYGFIIDTAEDGDIAVEMIKKASKDTYDLILMDIQMPRMDGYQATKMIREMDSELSGIPIVAMTANAFEEDRKAAFNAGMNEHISKPIDIKKLKTAMARLLNR